MTDIPNPFGPTPENPTGNWELPFEEVPPGNFIQPKGILVDSLDVTAGATDTPLGRLPVLIFQFHNSAGKAEVPPIIYVGNNQAMFGIQDLIQKASLAARKAAKMPKAPKDGTPP